MPGLAINTPISSLRAARKTLGGFGGFGGGPSMGTMGGSPSYGSGPVPIPPTMPGSGPEAPGGLTVPRPTTTPPTGYTPTGQPYRGLSPGEPTSVLTPNGPAMRQVAPGGNITEWNPNQAPPSMVPIPTNVARFGYMAGGAGGSSGTEGSGTGTGTGTGNSIYSFSDINRLLDKFAPTQQPRETGAPMEDERAAQAAAFGSAADKIGLIGRGNEQALKSYYATRGLSGSPVEAEGMAKAQNAIAGQLGQVTRDQAAAQLARQQQINDRNLSAQVNQRAQDLALANWKLSNASNVAGLLRQGFRPS